MSSIGQKRRLKPTEQCQYGAKCYRKNPHHFMEYAHTHLDKILELNGSNTDQYDIPSEMDGDRAIIAEQLKILHSLFPIDPPAKKVATETNCVSHRTSSSQAAATAGSSSQACSASNGGASTSRETKTTVIESAIKPSTSEQKPIKWIDASPIPPFPANIGEYIKVVLPRGKMAEKLARAAPYNYFLTAITSSKPTHTEPLSVTFQEILDPSLGEIESSVQINFMVDIGWLLGHYHFAGCMQKPLLVLYGEQTPELQTISQKKPQVTAIHVRMANPFSTHHTKMMLLTYKDKSMRVVISTANLYEDDWHNRTQGLWISPRLAELDGTCDTMAGESPTGFRADLLRYLTAYQLSHLQPWISRIRRADFSAINVFLITSVPGTHIEDTAAGHHHHGHARVGYLLSKHSAPIDDTSPVVAQCSSIGSFGANANLWLLAEFINSFRRDSTPMGLRKVPPFRLIYPSFNNVMGSHDGILGGGCLPYGGKIHNKQVWLQKYMFQWKATGRARNQAMPHIKTYARWTDKKLFWFMLTSANLSKAAWGIFNKGNKITTPLRISNYEAGVLFLPKFVVKQTYFPMDNDESTSIRAFPSLYDIPLTAYSCDDTPFLSDILFD